MKKSASPKFSAAALLQHQQQHGFNTHYFPTSAELLARYRQEYATKRAMHDALFNTLNESAAQLTVQTNTAEVRLLLPQELLEAILQSLLDKLQKELSMQEEWLLKQATYVERGINECGLDGSEEQWAIAELLAAPAQPVGTSSGKQAA